MKDTAMSQVKTAPVNMFTTLRPRLYQGQLLQEIKTMQASISKYGLLSPIVVSKANERLVVVDGRRRLAAIRRLEFLGYLPRSLVNTPYIEVQDLSTTPVQTPVLMSNRDLYMVVVAMFRETQDVAHIASELFLTGEIVRQILTLARLSPRIRRAFFDRTINFGSARAYTAIPRHALQDRIFMALGPFAEEQAILDYIRKPKATEPLRRAA